VQRADRLSARLHALIYKRRCGKQYTLVRPSPQVSRLRHMEAQQREAVAHAAERLRAEEASLQRRPADPQYAKLDDELKQVTGWVNEWSVGLVAQVSAHARVLELMALDLGALAAATDLAPWSSAEKEAGRYQLLGLARDVKRAQRHADGSLGHTR